MGWYSLAGIFLNTIFLYTFEFIFRIRSIVAKRVETDLDRNVFTVCFVTFLVVFFLLSRNYRDVNQSPTRYVVENYFSIL